MSKRSHDQSPAVAWLDEPEEHDYPAASSYLALVAGAALVAAAEDAFRSATSTKFKAKDILRAAHLEVLAETNPHVASDLAKVRAGHALAPVLLVRGDLRTGRPAQIADGYHRVCASYLTDENTDIPVRIIDVPESR